LHRYFLSIHHTINIEYSGKYVNPSFAGRTPHFEQSPHHGEGIQRIESILSRGHHDLLLDALNIEYSRKDVKGLQVVDSILE
jgi:hypothetical protein